MRFGDRQGFLIDLIDQLTSDRSGSREVILFLCLPLCLFWGSLGVFFFSSFPFLFFLFIFFYIGGGRKL